MQEYSSVPRPESQAQFDPDFDPDSACLANLSNGGNNGKSESVVQSDSACLANLSNGGNNGKSESVVQWFQPVPAIHCTKEPQFYCEGKPIKLKSWRDSREAHLNMASMFSRCSAYLLSHLPEDFGIFTANIKYPQKTADEWRQFKTKFGDNIRKYCKAHGCEISMLGKQHITIHNDGFNDIHFDLLGFYDLQRSSRYVEDLIRSWVNKAGGIFGFGAIEDRSEDNILRVSNYCFKYPNNPDQMADFWRKHPLPSKSRLLPVTWILGNFWRLKTAEFSITRYFNGELETKIRELSPQEQVYRLWKQSVFPDKIVNIESVDYIKARNEAKLLEVISELGFWDFSVEDDVLPLR